MSLGSRDLRKSPNKNSGIFIIFHFLNGTQWHFSILKYEERWSGNFRELIVKNISQADCGDYSVEARGAKQSAKLSIVKDKNQTTSALRAKAGPRKEIAPTAAKAVGRGE